MKYLKNPNKTIIFIRVFIDEFKATSNQNLTGVSISLANLPGNLQNKDGYKVLLCLIKDNTILNYVLDLCLVQL